MTFYIEKVKRKKGTRYRIVKDYTYQGERRREYFSLPSGTTKTQAEMIRMQMALEAGYGNYILTPVTISSCQNPRAKQGMFTPWNRSGLCSNGQSLPVISTCSF